MSIKNIGIQKYKIIIELGNDMYNKRKRMVRIFYGGLEEARKEEASLRAKYYHGLNSIKTSDFTFKEFSEIFIKNYCEKEISAVTAKDYIVCLKKIVPILGDLKLQQITPYLLDNMYEKLRIGVTKELGYYSMYNYFKVINVLFNTAIRWEFLDRNPNEKAKKPKKILKEKNFYNLEQVQKLITVMENESIRDRTIVQLAIDSGIRRSELASLRWSDLNFETKEMSINKSLKIVNGIIDEQYTKTISSIRKIILSDSTIQLLKEYRKWQEEYKKVNAKRWTNKEDRVFSGANGNPLHPDTFSHLILKITRKYNLDPISFHELRHTCASLLVNEGLDVKTISTRMGHSKSSTTLDIYTHCFEKSKNECANRMEKILNFQA